MRWRPVHPLVLPAAILSVAGLSASLLPGAAEAWGPFGVARALADGRADDREGGGDGAEAPRLRFNFKDTPYEQVMDFVARQTGLPVIREAELPGAPVTFISATDYTIDEAINILNRMLFMHGLQVRRERDFLYVTKLEDMKGFARAFDAEVPPDVGDADMVTIVVPLINAPAAPLAERLGPLTSQYGRITALPEQNVLVIVDTAAQCRRLRTIVERLDQEPPTDSQFKLFPLEHAQAETVLNALQGLIARRQQTVIIDERGRRRVVEDDEIEGLNIQADTRTNSIIAVGPEGRLRVVEQLVALLDRPEDDRRSREMMTFSLSAVSADDAAGHLRELFERLPEERRPTVLPIAQQSKVTVVGTGAQVAEAATLLLEVDPGMETDATRPAAPGEPTAAVIALEHATPANVENVVRRLLSPREQGVLRYAPTPDGEGLIVSGPARDVERFRELVSGIDRPVRADRQVRQVRIRRGEGSAVLARAEELYAQTSTSETHPVRAALERDTRTVTLIGAREGLNVFADLLRSAEETAVVERETRTYELTRARPSELAPRLSRLARSMLAPDDGSEWAEPMIEPVDELGSLIVRARPEEFGAIEELIGSLDEPGPADRVFRVVPFGNADPEELVGRAADLYRKQTEGVPDGEAGPVEVTIDRASGSLLLVAGSEGMTRFVSILNELQRMVEPEHRIRQVRVQRAEAGAILARAAELYGQTTAGRLNPVRAVLEEDGRTVTLVGGAEGIGAFADLLRSTEETWVVERETRTYELAKARPSELAPRLSRLARPMLEPDDGSEWVAPTLEPMDELDTLLVRARPDQFAVLERLIGTLDEPGPADRAFRVVRYGDADPERLVSRARGLYEQQTEGLPEEEAGPVDVTIDETSGSLLLVAGSRGMTRFVSILNELQRMVGPARQTRLIELEHVTPREVVEFLGEMISTGRPFAAMPGPDPVLEPIEATGSILVAAQPAQFSIIEQLVRNLDRARTAERPPLRILRLRTTDAAELARALNASYGERSSDERARQPVDIRADVATNTLMVSAHPDVFPEIERVVNELNQTEAVTTEGREIRIFPLRVARAADLAQTIDQMFPEPPVPIDARGRPMPEAQEQREVIVRAHPGTNSLIVDAPVHRLAGFEQLVRQLDQQRPPENVELRTYRVRRADLDAVARTLRNLAAADTLAGAPGSQRAQIAVETEPVSRSLIVSGPAEIFAEVEKVLAELDAPPERPETALRMYALEHARAERLQPLLDRLLTARLREKQEEERLLVDPRSLLDVAADPATNTLIITAPEPIQQIAQELIRSLDTEAATVGRAVIRVVPLTYASADDAARTLTRSLPDVELPSGGSVNVMAVSGSNALLMSGASADLDKVEELLESLDVRPVTDDAMDIRTFELEHADAAAIAQTVQRLLAEQQQTDPRILSMQLRYTRGQLPQVPQVRVEADQRTNSLVVSGPTATLELADSIIDRLDRPAGETGRETAVFTPAKADPERLVRTVTPILRSTMAPGRREVEIVAEPASGSVVIVGSDDQIAEALRLLADFDDRAVAAPRAELEVFELEHAESRTVASSVQRMLGDRSRWPERLVAAERAGLAIASPTVNAEERANRLIVSAPRELMPVARALIETLDRPAERGPVEVRVFSLRKSSAESVAAALRSGLTAGARPGEPSPVVTAETGSNSIVVAASPERLAEAGRLVESLDEVAQPDGVTVRTIFLRHARADAVAPVVERLLHRESVLEMLPQWARVQVLQQEEQRTPFRVAAERRLNAVVVSGPVGLIDVAEQIVTELDVDAAERVVAPERKVRVLTLEGADAQEVAANIEAVFADEAEHEGPPPVVRVDRSSNSLVVRAGVDQLAVIEGLVRSLDRAALVSARELRLIPVDRSRAEAGMMAEALKRLLEQRGGVKVEIITAEELLSEGGDPLPQRGGDARPVRGGAAHPFAAAVLAAVFAVVDDVEDENGEDGGGAGGGDGGEDAGGDVPTVTIAIDPATNSLIVLGSTRLADRIAALAAELERQMPPEPGRVRLVELPEHVDARSLLPVLNSIVGQIGRAGPQNPGGFTGRVALQADPAGDALIVSANDTDFRSVAELIRVLARPDPGARVTVKIYPLENVSAQHAQRAVSDLISAQPRGRQARQLRAVEVTIDGEPAVIDPENVRVTPDPGGTALIVAAPSEALPVLDRFIAMLDQAPVGERVAIRRYDLDHAGAQDTARTLQNVFDAARQDPRVRGLPRARFIADERTNSLLITAADRQFEEIEWLLGSLDTAIEDERTEVALIPLKTARARVVREVVEAVLVGRDEGRRERARITASDEASMLVVRGTAEQIESAREIIEEVDRAETPDMPVRAVKLERADAQAVARALQQFFDDRARAGARPGQRAPARRVAVVGDQRTSTLVISASDEDFETIESLIETFDSPSLAQDLQFKFIPLENARVGEIRATLENMVNAIRGPMFFSFGPRGAQQPDTLAVQFDERSNSVIVIGKGEGFETVERIVAAIDVPALEEAKLVLRAVRLEHADPQVVSAAIRGALSTPGWQPWRGVDPEGVRVEVDRRTRTLVLIGRAERVEEAEAYASQLDAASSAPDRVIESIRLRFARADQIAGSVQRFFAERARAVGLPDAGVAVLGSREGNVLVVSAGEDDMELVRQILAQMDQPEEEQDRRRDLYHLRNADAQEVAATLRQQFPPAAAARSGVVIVTPMRSTNSVVVSAPEELHERIGALVAQLDAPPSIEDTRIVTVALSTARADEVASALARALPANVKVAVTPVRRTNSLLLTGSDEALEIALEQIARLDEQPTRSPTEFRRVRLDHVDALDMAITLRSLARQLRADPQDPEPAISSSRRDNTLLISATADQQEQIAGVIEQLDVPSDTERRTEFVALQYADAKATAAALDVFYGRYAPEAQTPGARLVTIIPNPVSRSLVISADEQEWPGIRALLEQLDNEEYDTSRRLEIIALRHADATSVAQALTQAFQAPLRAELERERARQRQRDDRRRDDDFDVPPVLLDTRETVTVAAERLTNSLVVSAGREDIERIRAVVERIDVPDSARLPEARVIALRDGPASAVAASLRELFADAEGARRTGPRSVVIVGDDRSNTLIVRAEESQFVQIKALADAIEQEGGRARAQVRVIRVRGVPAARLAPTIRTVFGPAARQRNEALAVEVDRAANALVISSSEGLYNEIREVVRELDGSAQLEPDAEGRPAVGVGQTIFIIDVENNSPEEVRRMLEAMGVTRPQPDDRPGVVSEPVTIVPLKTRRALAVIANAQDGEAVVSLVRSLDAEPGFADQHVAVVRLRNASAQAVASALSDILRPGEDGARTDPARALAEQIRRLSIHRDGADEPELRLDLSVPIRVRPEPQTNSVVLSSTRENVAALRSAVVLLDRLPIGAAVVVRFFPLENASAQRVSAVVRDLFTQGERLRRAPGVAIDGEPTTEVGKALIGEIAVSVDDRTNSLLVAGREEAVALVEVLVRQLDGDRAASWVEPTLIPLEHADASRIAETLRRAIIDGARESPEAQALQRQIGRLRVAAEGKDPTDPDARVESDLFVPMSTLVLLPEPQLNALIVVGSTANTRVVSELVKMLDVPAAAAANQVRLFPLRYAAADRVGAMLRDIFRQQTQAGVIRTEDDLILTSDLRTNTLIISTSPRSFTVVEKLLEDLDGTRVDPTVRVEVIQVPGADVTALAPRIERLMRDRIEAATRAGEVRSASDTFSIQPDPGTNSLIVAASEENLEVIKGLIDLLQRGAETLAESQVLEVIHVRSARAGDLLPALRELYVDRQNRVRGDDSVRVTPEARLNALVVRGTPDDVRAIRGLVERLDGAQVSAVTDIKRIELRRAEAAEIVTLLQNVLAGRPLAGTRVGERQAQVLRFIREEQAAELEETTGRAPSEAEISGAIQEQVTITAETRTNSVVVVAPARLMVLIEDLINDLDTTVAGARTIEIFKLENADARAMAEILRDLFNLRQLGDTFVLTPSRDAETNNGGGNNNDSEEEPALVRGASLYPTADLRQQLAITVDSRTNHLLVSATAEYLEEVRRVVESLDSIEATEREQIVYELRNARALEVAATLREYFRGESDAVRQILGPERIGALDRLLEREVTVQGDEKSNRLLIGVSPRYKETIDKIVAELDSTPPQVMIQVLLAEVTLDASKTWGIDFTVGPFGGDDYSLGFLGAGGGVATALGVPNFSVSSVDFELLIRALEAQGRLEVLSRPHILVNNNEEARIQVGENISVVTGVVRDQRGDLRSEVERRDIGIILNVTPSIASDGFVRMDIEPEISSLSARTIQISEDFQAPIINQRNVETNVTVKDGETIIIGGLIQSNIEQRRSKVPLLGDIPIAGELFRSHRYSNVKTELLVILTPRVIHTGTRAGDALLRDFTDWEIDGMPLSEPILERLRRGDLGDGVRELDAREREIHPRWRRRGVDRDPPADIDQRRGRGPFGTPPAADPPPGPDDDPDDDAGGGPGPDGSGGAGGDG